MTKMINMNVRLDQEEYSTISEAARSEGSTISEYVRNKVLGDQNNDDPDFQKRLMKSLLQVHLLTKQIAKKSLSEEDYKEAIETSKQLMEKWGYE